jgi:hypothetical protein
MRVCVPRRSPTTLAHYGIAPAKSAPDSTREGLASSGSRRCPKCAVVLCVCLCFACLALLGLGQAANRGESVAMASHRCSSTIATPAPCALALPRAAPPFLPLHWHCIGTALTLHSHCIGTSLALHWHSIGTLRPFFLGLIVLSTSSLRAPLYTLLAPSQQGSAPAPSHSMLPAILPHSPPPNASQ